MNIYPLLMRLFIIVEVNAQTARRFCDKKVTINSECPELLLTLNIERLPKFVSSTWTN